MGEDGTDPPPAAARAADDALLRSSRFLSLRHSSTVYTLMTAAMRELNMRMMEWKLTPASSSSRTASPASAIRRAAPMPPTSPPLPDSGVASPPPVPLCPSPARAASTALLIPAMLLATGTPPGPRSIPSLPPRCSAIAPRAKSTSFLLCPISLT